MEGGDGAAHRDAWQALVQPVEKIGAAGPQRFGQHAPPGVGWQRGAPRAQIAMRPVTEIEAYFRVGAGQTHQDFMRVKSHPREHLADAVSRVQGNLVRIWQTVTRYRIVSSSGRVPVCQIRTRLPWTRLT